MDQGKNTGCNTQKSVRRAADQRVNININYNTPKTEGGLLLGKSDKQFTAIARKWITNNFPVIMNMHTTIEELLDMFYSMQYGLYLRKIHDCFFPELLIQYLLEKIDRATH
jgi:hypothetical protein